MGYRAWAAIPKERRKKKKKNLTAIGTALGITILVAVLESVFKLKKIRGYWKRVVLGIENRKR